MQRNALSTDDNQTVQSERPARQMGNRRSRYLYLFFRLSLGVTLIIALLQLTIAWVVEPIAVLSSAPFLFDFSYYYVAALTLRLNPHANIYDPRVMPAMAHARHLFIGVGAGTFNYPLLLPIALMPLTLLSFPLAARIWYFFNIALWILNTALLIDLLRLGLLGASSDSQGQARNWLHSIRGVTWRSLIARLRGRSDAARFTFVFGLFVCLFYGPTIATQNLGQASMLILTCFLLALWFLRRGRPELAGVMLTIATLIKIFPVFLLLYFALRRQWRVVLGALGSLLILLAGMVAVVGLSGVLLMRDILSAVTSGVFTTFQNESLERAPMWIAIELGMRPDNPAAALVGRALMALAGLAFLAIVFVLMRRERRGTPTSTSHFFSSFSSSLAHEVDEEDLVLGFCWALCTMLLISPVNWEHYDIWLLPAMLFGLGYTLRHAGSSLRDAKRRWKPDAWLALMILAALTLTFSHLPLGYDGTLTLSPGPYVAGHPLRPFFMLLRPTSAVLVWLATGVLFVRHRISAQRPPEASAALTTGERPHVAARSLLDAWRYWLNYSLDGSTAAAASVPWQRLFGVLLAFWFALIALSATEAFVISLATPH